MLEDPKKAKVERVMVHLRIRPLSDDDMARYGRDSSVEFIDESRGIVVLRKEYDKKTFNFDSVFDGNSHQEEVYRRVAEPVVTSVIEGYNGTIFSYGQTGTGKTFTMIGSTNELQGIIPRSAEQIFDYMHSCHSHAFTVKVAFLQIYMEMLQDLIAPTQEKPIRIREDPEEGVYLSGMVWTAVNCTKECMDLMYQGDKNRNTAFTSMNSHSSRSHAVYMIKMEKRVKYTGEELEELEKKGENPDKSMTKSTLYLVDLAGSERVSKSKAAGSRLDEAKNINLGLLALGNCIQALADKKAKYVPFRDSKLTRLLEDSLGGNSKTSLVVTIGPSLGHYQESISSLLFGTRAMKVENRPELNITVDYKALCAQLQAEIDRINDSNSMWTIERQQLIEKITKLNSELENSNSDKAEMQITITELRRKHHDINLSAYEESKHQEISNLKAYYKEKMKKKEAEFKRVIEEFDKNSSEQDHQLSHFKVQLMDLEGKNVTLKYELKRTKEELEHERIDRQIRTNQMTTEIEDLQRLLAAEKARNEKAILVSHVGNESETVKKYEDIIRTNEENFRRSCEEYETEIAIVRDNLQKLSIERDELSVEKTKLLGRLTTLTKKASHIAKESVRIRSETENHNQEVKILKASNNSLKQQYDDALAKLEEAEEEKEALQNNITILSKINQKPSIKEIVLKAKLEFIVEEAYKINEDNKKITARLQEKLLYFLTQKNQVIIEVKENLNKVVVGIKEKIKNMQEKMKESREQSEKYAKQGDEMKKEIEDMKRRLVKYEPLQGNSIN